MLYTLRVFLQNQTLVRRIIRKTKKILGIVDMDNATLIRKYSLGKSFADIGALWGIDGLNSFIAEEAGASKVLAIDVYPPSQKFFTEKKRRNSMVEFVQGDINLPETIEKIGQADVVFCSGVLYHTPDPVHMLLQLRSICKETLILNTAAIPEMHGVRNGAIFYPFLDESQRKIWNQGIGTQRGITGPYEPKEGYANWFWGMTPSVIASMLQCAGFEVVEKHITSFRAIFVARAIPIQFSASSGAWTTPKDPASKVFQR